MKFAHIVFSSLLWLLAPASHAERTLNNNPFDKPPGLSPGANVADQAKEEVEMTLRGVMLGSTQNTSLVNVGGRIAGIGDQLDGYTVLGIEPRRVVLGKGNAQVVLTLDEEDE